MDGKSEKGNNGEEWSRGKGEVGDFVTEPRIDAPASVFRTWSVWQQEMLFKKVLSVTDVCSFSLLLVFQSTGEECQQSAHTESTDCAVNHCAW